MCVCVCVFILKSMSKKLSVKHHRRRRRRLLHHHRPLLLSSLVGEAVAALAARMEDCN